MDERRATHNGSRCGRCGILGASRDVRTQYLRDAVATMRVREARD